MTGIGSGLEISGVVNPGWLDGAAVADRVSGGDLPRHQPGSRAVADLRGRRKAAGVSRPGGGSGRAFPLALSRQLPDGPPLPPAGGEGNSFRADPMPSAPQRLRMRRFPGEGNGGWRGRSCARVGLARRVGGPRREISGSYRGQASFISGSGFVYFIVYRRGSMLPAWPGNRGSMSPAGSTT